MCGQSLNLSTPAFDGYHDLGWHGTHQDAWIVFMRMRFRLVMHDGEPFVCSNALQTSLTPFGQRGTTPAAKLVPNARHPLFVPRGLVECLCGLPVCGARTAIFAEKDQGQ